MNNRYYVYILCDPRKNNQPFYVGKGSGRRAIRHLEETLKVSDNRHKYYKIQKIRSDGFEPVIEYHAIDLSEDEAYKIETDLIQKYGRENFDEGGILTNFLIDGRPPIRSGPMSQEQKDAIRKGNTGKKRTFKQSAYLSSIRKGKSHGACAEETKEKIRLSNIAAKANVRLSIDLTSKCFGSWTVLDKGRDLRPRIRGASAIYWICECVCGRIKEIQQSTLVKGLSNSCGCQYLNVT